MKNEIQITKKKKRTRLSFLNERRIIYGRIDAIIALAEKRGKHRLEPGCFCITCYNKRKTPVLKNQQEYWKYTL